MKDSIKFSTLFRIMLIIGVILGFRQVGIKHAEKERKRHARNRADYQIAITREEALKQYQMTFPQVAFSRLKKFINN